MAGKSCTATGCACCSIRRQKRHCNHPKTIHSSRCGLRREKSTPGHLPRLRCSSESAAQDLLGHAAVTQIAPVHEARKIATLAIPSIATLLAGFGVQTLSVFFISQIGQAELAAAVLACSVFNATGLSVMYGLAGAMDTLCGQAYGGRNFRMIGIVAQRACLIMCAVSVPLVLVWTQLKHPAILFGLSAEIVEAASRYMLWIAPQLPFHALTAVIHKFQTSQNIMAPLCVINMCVFLLCPFIFNFYINHLGLGLFGAAMAHNTTAAVTALSMLAIAVYLHCSRAVDDSKRLAWPGFSSDALRGWGQFLCLGVPSCLMLCLEWWFFECSSLLSGLLPNPAAGLVIFGICMQIMELLSMVAHGISVAVRTRVSNFLGAGEAAAAAQTVRIALAACWALLLLFLSGLLHFRERLVAAFLPHAAPNSLEVVGLSTCILYGIAGSVGDWTNAIMGAALQGAGKQRLGARIYAATHWLLGPILLYTFAFRWGWGVVGIWAAIALVNTVQSGFMLESVRRIDWESEAEKAQHSMKMSSDFSKVSLQAAIAPHVHEVTGGQYAMSGYDGLESGRDGALIQGMEPAWR